MARALIEDVPSPPWDCQRLNIAAVASRKVRGVWSQPARSWGLAAPAEIVLASLLAVRERLELGRQVVARLVAEGLPVLDGVRWRVADARLGPGDLERS